MSKTKGLYLLILLFTSLMLSACGNDDSAPKITVDAGQNLSINENQVVEVTGVLQDPRMKLSGAAWSQRSGISVDLTHSKDLLLTFVAPTVSQTEILTFELSASSESGELYSDTLEVTVLNVNQPPQIDLVDTLQVAEQRTIKLQAQVTDADSDSQSITYQWRQIPFNNQAQLTTSETNTTELSVNIPALSSAQSYQFELSVSDEQQATNSKVITLEALPVLQGRVIDDPISQSTVSLKDWHSGALIAETQSDETGYFEFLLDNTSRYFLVESSGGLINGEAFLGRLSSGCELTNRKQCNLTPISSLILNYATRNDLRELSQQSQWVDDIEALIGEISPDPFLSGENNNINVASIRTILGSQGENIQTWLNQVVDYIDEPNNSQFKQQIEQSFNYLNFLPIVNAGNDQSVNEQSMVILNANASDINGAIASFAWTQLSGTNVSLSNPNTAIASFASPTVIAAETLVFQITVADTEGGIATDSVSVSVNPINTAPLIADSAAQSVNEQASVVLSVDATDVDGRIVSYAWTQLSGTNVTLSNTNTAITSFTSPALITTENLVFQVLVTDNEGMSTIGMVSVTVNPINTAPIATAGADQTVNEQTSVVLSVEATDVDGLIVSYAWTQLSGSNVTLNDANSAIADFTSPTLIATENLVFQVLVTDNEGLRASDTVSVSVNPVNTAPIVSAGVAQTVNEQTNVALSGVASDADGSITSYAWAQLSGSSVTLNDANSANASFTSPTLTTADTLVFQITVTDDEGAVISDTVSVSVNPVNTAPTVSAGVAQTVNEQTNVALSGVASDADGSIASYAWAQLSGSSVTLNDANSANASFTSPTLTTADTLVFQITVTDDEGAVISDTVAVSVNPVNTVPIVSAGVAQTVNEQTNVALSGVASDADGSIASYAWAQLSGSSVTLNDANSANASFTSPTLTTADTLVFQITVTDDEGAVISDTVAVSVNPVNTAPIVSAGVAQTVNEQTNVALSGVASDADGSIASYAWAQLSGTNVNLSNPNSANASFTSPTLTTADTLVFQITVTDDEGAVISDTVAVSVNPVNTAPIVSAGVAQTVNEQTNVALSGVASDADGSIASYAWAQLSGSSVTLNDANSANASFTSPTLTTADTLVFQITVTDDEGAVISDTVSVSVNPVNTVPTVSAGASQSVNEQTSVVIYADANDADGNIATYSWTQLSGTNVSLSTADKAIASFTAPTLLSSETLVFQITVTDNEGESVTDTLSISVNPINTGPIVTTGADQSVNEQTSVMLTVNASDADGNIASYTWTQLSGTNISLSDANTAIASFTSPTIVTSENLVFQVLVTDNEGESQIGLTRVTVNPVNTAPTVSAGNDQTIDEQNNVSLNATANDTDGSIATYQWQQTAGVTVSLQDANTENASFIAPEVSGDSVVQLEVTVTDNEGISVSDNVSITIANNFSPTADIIAPILVRETELVVLDGSGSTDTETANLQYEWQQTDNSGISIAFADSSLEQLQFTAPNVTTSIVVAISLTVSDEGGKTATNEVSIALTPSNTNLAPINDTGISTCADYAFGASESHQNSVDCNLTTDADGDSVPQDQDGHVGRDINASNNDDGKLGFSFIKLDSQGQALNADATSWSCVLDTVTELIWEVKTTDSGLQDIHHNYSWLDNNNSQNGGNSGGADAGSCVGTCDTESYVNSVNALSLCGLTNWRVPAYPELQSLVDYSQTNFAIENDYFPNTDNDGYWTSTTLSQFNSAAWRVNFNLTIDRLPFALKSTTFPVRLVHDLP
ncbi:PKD domain-containing protein [Agarivorans sp. MS3-6]